MSTTETYPVNRRRFLAVGAGIAAGTLATGTASADSGRYIVGTASPRAARAARRASSSVRRVLDFGPRGGAVAGQFSVAALRELSRRPDVRYVEADAPMYAIGGVADIEGSDAEVPWGVDRVDAEKVHATATGAGADVAIIDTGIDNDHPDLAGNLGAGVSFTVGPWWRDDTSTDPKDWDDGNGHGTHCAGIAAAVDDGAGVVGVAPAPTLHAVKVLDDRGSGTTSDVAAGITYVADQGWHVGSLSLGGSLSQTLQDACDYAYGKGVLLVAAAGNDGGDVADSAPAAYASVLAVSATDDTDALASWSNTGAEIELAAPGVGIYSTYKNGTYEWLSGTSMACPHVSGAGGLLAAAGYTNADARARLQTTAEDLGSAGHDPSYGYGLLDVEAAVGGGDGGGTDDSTDTTAPAAPTDLTVGAVTETTVDLTWTAPPDDDVAHYDVYVDGAQYVESADTAEQVGGLTGGTEYQFTVTATDTTGNESAQSDPATATTASSDTGGGTAPVVDSFTATSGSPNNPHADVEMAWQVSGSPDAVTLELYEGSIETGESPLRSWSVSASGTQTYQEKFASPKSYTARLVATNANGTAEERRSVTA